MIDCLDCLFDLAVMGHLLRPSHELNEFLCLDVRDLVRYENQACKAGFRRCDLSGRFFGFMIYHCMRLKALRNERASLNRVAADKSHSVIVDLSWG